MLGDILAVLFNWIFLPILVIVGAVIIFIIIYRIIYRPAFDFPKGAYVVPTNSIGLKIFGQVFDIVRDEGGSPQMRWAESALKEGKTVVAYDFSFSTRAVQVLHPTDVMYLLAGEAEYSLRKHKDYDRLADLLGKFGLVTLRDPKLHSEMRRLMAPAFQSRNLNAIANYIVPKHAVILDQQLAKAAQAESNKREGTQLGKIFDKFTLAVIVEAAFKKLSIAGIDIGGELERVQVQIGLSLFDLLPLWLSKHIPTKRRTTVLSVQRNVSNITKEMLHTVRAQYANGEIKAGTEVLLDFIAKEKDLNDEMAAHNLLTILFAGHETTSRALQWTTMALAQHPKVQERLYEELCDAVALHTQPSLEDLKDCSYLEMVVKESLRLWPPAPIVAREAIKEIVLPHSGVIIPEGCRVAFPIFNIQRSKEVYGEDAYEFRPERWEDPKVKAQIERFPAAWMPFLPQKHHRNCIGSTFAWNELLIGVASMVRSFKLEWLEGQQQPKRKWAITMRPDPDPKIRIVPREA
jgi:cytochrome P450